jgi:hypothetical protein
MAAVYPGTLPVLDFATLGARRPSNVIRSETEAKHAKVRRRFSSVGRRYSQVLVVNETQRATFDSFFYATLAGGALTFDHDEPIDGGTVECRFISGPEWQIDAHHSSPTRLIWSTPIEFEVLT